CVRWSLYSPTPTLTAPQRGARLPFRPRWNHGRCTADLLRHQKSAVLDHKLTCALRCALHQVNLNSAERRERLSRRATHGFPGWTMSCIAVAGRVTKASSSPATGTHPADPHRARLAPSTRSRIVAPVLLD